MSMETIAPGTFDVYVMPERGHPLELVWRHSVAGLGQVEVSLTIVRSAEESVARAIRERSLYIGQDAYGTPLVTLRLSDAQAHQLTLDFQRAQNRREQIYERPVR